jgi:hypothetical protein
LDDEEWAFVPLRMRDTDDPAASVTRWVGKSGILKVNRVSNPFATGFNADVFGAIHDLQVAVGVKRGDVTRAENQPSSVNAAWLLPDHCSTPIDPRAANLQFAARVPIPPLVKSCLDPSMHADAVQAAPRFGLQPARSAPLRWRALGRRVSAYYVGWLRHAPPMDSCRCRTLRTRADARGASTEPLMRNARAGL